MALEGELHIILPLVVGFLIGLIEAYFVYEDENMTSGKDFLGDMWHGLLFAIAGTIISFFYHLNSYNSCRYSNYSIA